MLSAPYWVTALSQSVPADGDCQAGTPPETVSTCPVVPIPSRVAVAVPPVTVPPRMMSPVLVITLVSPVPPWTWVNTPGDGRAPAVVQTQKPPCWSTAKSPSANVPVAGAAPLTAPTYRDGTEFAPVRPVGANMGGWPWTWPASAAFPIVPAAAVAGLAAISVAAGPSRTTAPRAAVVASGRSLAWIADRPTTAPVPRRYDPSAGSPLEPAIWTSASEPLDAFTPVPPWVVPTSAPVVRSPVVGWTWSEGAAPFVPPLGDGFALPRAAGLSVVSSDGPPLPAGVLQCPVASR